MQPIKSNAIHSFLEWSQTKVCWRYLDLYWTACVCIFSIMVSELAAHFAKLFAFFRVNVVVLVLVLTVLICALRSEGRLFLDHFLWHKINFSDCDRCSDTTVWIYCPWNLLDFEQIGTFFLIPQCVCICTLQLSQGTEPSVSSYLTVSKVSVVPLMFYVGGEEGNEILCSWHTSWLILFNFLSVFNT